MNPTELRSLLIDALGSALRALDPAAAVQRALLATPANSSVDVLAVGKGAPRMTQGALDTLGQRVSRALVVTTDRTPADFHDPRVALHRAAHPVPDERSTLAATTALAFASSCVADLLVVLVSGGASSLLCAPNNASLDEYRALTLTLLSSGADIRAVNIVRRHLSNVHGGGLARASRVPVQCLIASDVVGGPPWDVGSGPACVDPTTTHDAATILRRYLAAAEVDAWLARLRETPKCADDLPHASTCMLIARPEDFGASVAQSLRHAGFPTQFRVVCEASAEELTANLVSTATALAPGHASVMTCEPTLTLPNSTGRGGRAGWVALAALQRLPANTALLAGASDGVDGASGAGGACVSADQLAQVDRGWVAEALDARNDAVVHEQLGTHLPGVPTGLNLTDVYVVVRARC